MALTTIMRVLPTSNEQPISTAGIFQWLNIERRTNVQRAVLSRPTIMITVGLSALLFLPCLPIAQTADDIFKRAQERFAQDEKTQASWSAEGREAADKVLVNLKAERCSDKDAGPLCDMVVLCSRAPEIAGERLPDDKELTAANQALDDVGDDLKKMASAIGQMKIASARFQKGARVARDRCEAKVRMAYRSVAGPKSDPDESIETNTPDIYNGPVAIRPLHR